MCGTPLTEAASERRKLATLVFCDMTGSTALGERLDAEAVRDLRSRYFAEMRAAIEAHGGRVEKYIGDAVMAVFGVPVAHEDDAVRAVRAAAEMRERLGMLNDEFERRFGTRIDLHLGVNTGEVVTGDGARGEPLVTGDAVNVAARLERAAPAGEIVVGEQTRRLAAIAATFEALPPLALEGKSQPVAAYRLVSVAQQHKAIRSRGDAPLVGRNAELGILRLVYDRVVAERATRLCVLLGEPGVGKSRLAAEFISSLEGEATALEGHCLSYGEGITYWPLAEIVRGAAGVVESDTAERRAARIATLVEGEERAESLAAALAAVAGVGEAATGPGEIAWAARTLFRALARSRPLVLVLDDLHWAEPGLLELLDSLLEHPSDAPVLVLGVARPELADVRPGWESLRLELLGDEDVEHLVASLAASTDIDARVLGRAVVASGGNPLFAEELISMLAEDPATEIPPTLEALLGARLDRLSEDERRAAERGAVEGQTFHLGAVEELTEPLERARVPAALDSLSSRELVRSARAVFAAETAYRFRHILLRDAAYRTIPKRLRAVLHERFSDWLARAVAGREGEVMEILGYHLEQAYRCRLELGMPDEGARELGQRAADRLAAAARRADALGDAAATANLFERALAVLDPEDPSRLPLLPELGRTLFEGGDLGGAEAAVAEATASGDSVTCAHAQLVEIQLAMQHDTSVPAEAQLQKANQIVTVLEEAGDHIGAARALILVALIRHMSLACSAEARGALLRALSHAERGGAVRELTLIRGRLCNTATRGPMHTTEAIALCERTLDDSEGLLDLEARAAENLGWLYGMTGRFGEGRRMLAHAREIRSQLGQQLFTHASGQGFGALELLAGDPAAAERELRLAAEGLERLGALGFLATVDAMLSQALYAQDRFAEADAAATRCELGAGSDDLFSQFLSKLTRARLLARNGMIADSMRVAHDAIALAAGTDFLDWQGDAQLALADVLELGGRSTEAREPLAAAIALYERKGCTAMLERTRRRAFGGAASLR